MTVFDEELQCLNDKILKMGCLVEEALKNAIHALADRNNVQARMVIDNEKIVDTLDMEIDEACIRLITLRQSTAIDLRFITTAMKVSSELERMGDLAVNIAAMATELNEEPELNHIDIPKMSDITRGMMRDVLDAFVRRDAPRAAYVIARDKEIDDLKVAIIKELSLVTAADPSLVNRALKVNFVAHYLKCIADHTTNIAELIYQPGEIINNPDLTSQG